MGLASSMCQTMLYIRGYYSYYVGFGINDDVFIPDDTDSPLWYLNNRERKTFSLRVVLSYNCDSKSMTI